jgi:type 2 lantibiotic biosynthesis protein LanM
VDAARVAERFAAELTTLLAWVAAPTLAHELAVRREAGRLSGATSRERFADFVTRTAEPGGLADLFAGYPTLHTVLLALRDAVTGALNETIARFTADRAAIVADLLGGADPGALVGVGMGLGDRHAGGRSVARLRFADGRQVIYKPRSVDSYVHFGQFCGWLAGRAEGLDLRQARCVRRDGYGWLEYVAPARCADLAAVERFYRRLGALLAVCYALDATDLHYENLIAAGEYPVLVDLETLLHPDFDLRTASGTDPAIRALTRSVFRTSLLPRMVFGENGALDVSGMGGDRGDAPVTGPRWVDAGTDLMRLTRGTVAFAGGHNRPGVGERDAEPGEHADVLVAGFRTAYGAIVAHRADLLAVHGPVMRFAGDRVRLVARNTEAYATLLYESLAPDAMRDPARRERVLAGLAENGVAELTGLREAELAALRALDVPLFTHQPAARDVWPAGGAAVTGLLPRPGLSAVRAKIDRMGEADLRDQEWLIRAGLAVRTAHAGHSAPPLAGPPVAAVADPRRFLLAARGIGDELLASARHSDGRAGWLGLEAVDDAYWSLLPLGAGLATGYCGVALFLAELGERSGAARYTDLARRALHPVPALLASLRADPRRAAIVGCGAFDGLGGIAYALARLSVLLADPDVRAAAETAVVLAADTADPEQPWLADGLAGGLVSMLAVHAEIGSARARSAAVRMAGMLAEVATTAAGQRSGGAGRTGGGGAGGTGGGGAGGTRGGGAGGAGPGLLRGTAGLGWALRRAGIELADERCRAEGAVLLRRAWNARATVGGSGWCQGSAGLAVAVAAGHAEADIPAGEVAELARAIARRPRVADFSLCHGELGAVEGLAELAAHGVPAAAAGWERERGSLLGAIGTLGPLCGTPRAVPTPGLLGGLAGIGYGLLRLGSPDLVPSVLTLGHTMKRPIRSTMDESE